MSPRYLNYKNFSVNFHPENFTFQICYSAPGVESEECIVEAALCRNDGTPLPENPPEPRYDLLWANSGTPFDDCRVLEHKFTYRAPGFSEWVKFIFTSGGLSLCTTGHLAIRGTVNWSQSVRNTFACCTTSHNNILYGNCGPAASPFDDALFDREKDRLLYFSATGKCRIRFDWEKNAYGFLSTPGWALSGNRLFFRVAEHYCAGKLNIPYRMIDKSGIRATPPVSWMTWYAVRFEAGEKEVLENARAIREKLGHLCRNLTVWVDWEYCHADHSGRASADYDWFHCRREAYPDGMAHTAAGIRDAGCIPGIWTGFTNDGRINEFLAAHPDTILNEHTIWSGSYWIDPTHEKIYSLLIPKMAAMLTGWGYRAIKWDCLPASLREYDENHAKFKDPRLSPTQAMHKLIAAFRKEVGEDVYLLSCNTVDERGISLAADVFDAARIGGDVFSFDDFVKQALDRLPCFYPLHNTCLYADCDNLVLRRDYNTDSQARARASFYGLCGLPVTIGDRMSELDDIRLGILKKILPVLDVSPVEFQQKKTDNPCRIFVLNAAVKGADFTIVHIYNVDMTAHTVKLRLDTDCRMDTAHSCAASDFWEDRFLGIISGELEIEVPPQACRVIRLTPVTEPRAPLLVSTSRHIGQGALELQDIVCNSAAGRLSGKIRWFAGEEETLSFFVPEGCRTVGASAPLRAEGGVWKMTIHPERTETVPWYLDWNMEKNVDAAETTKIPDNYKR